MKTQKVQIETIKLDPSNPRSITKEAFERLKKSITDFPEMQSVKPLVVADGYALAGNMRLLAYKDLGYRELHVLDVSEWSQAKRDEFMIKDNTHYGTWDYDALANEWETLPLTDWGLDVWEPEVEEIKGLTDEDEVPEAPQEPITKLGDVWILGEHRVMCGDSTSKEAVEILMDGQKADMVFTDPPYGIGYEYNEHKDEQGDKYLEFCTKFWSVLNLFSKLIVITPGWKYKPFWYMNSPYDEMVWFDKTKQSGGKAFYLRKSEPIFIFGKVKAKYTWDTLEIQGNRGDKIREVHTCPKPVELIEELIKPQTQLKDIVLDIFLGSGTTLIVCEKLNRKCYGMELDPKYCDVIVKRWEDFTGKKAHLEENEFEVMTQAH